MVVGLSRTIYILGRLGFWFLIFKGLRLAWEQGLRRLVLEVDFQLVVHLLSSSSECENHCHNVIMDCRDLFGREWKVIIKHFFRENN